jgi:hypothetical protein
MAMNLQAKVRVNEDYTAVFSIGRREILGEGLAAGPFLLG